MDTNLTPEQKAAQFETKLNANVDTKVKEATQALETKIKDVTGENELLQKSIEDAKTEIASIKAASVAKAKAKKGELLNSLEEKKDEIASFRNKKTHGLDIQLKASLTPANAYGSGDGANVPLEERFADIVYTPNYMNRIMANMPMYSASGGSIRWNQETRNLDNSDPKAQGALHGESEFTITNQNTPVQTIGATITIAEEILDDTAGMQSYIVNRLMGNVMDTMDEQILSGNSTVASASDNDLVGLFTAGNNTAFSASDTIKEQFVTTATASEFTANLYDVLAAAKSQLKSANFMPDRIFMHPDDVTRLSLLKSTAGEYILRQVQSGLLPTVFGAKIIETPAVAAGSYLVADMSKYAGLHMREGLNIQFERSGDDFKRNNVTVRGQFRAAVTPFLPAAAVSGTYAAGITDLHSA